VLSSTGQAHLQQAGYRTCMVGKYLHNLKLADPPAGFDRFTWWQSYDYYGFKANVDGRITDTPAYSTTYAANRLLTYLREFSAGAQPAPWYCYLAFRAPHVEVTPGARLAVPQPRYEDAPVRKCVQAGGANVSDKPPYIRQYQFPVERTRQICKSQLRSLMSVDYQIDRIHAVRPRHRSAPQQHGRLLERQRCRLGGPQLVRQGSCRTCPASASRCSCAGRGTCPRARTPAWCPTWTSTRQSWTPPESGSTPLLNPLDGHSLLTPARRPYQFNEHFYDADNPPIPPPGWAQVHTTTWSYTEYYDKAGAITFREYYNLRADPGQWVNLLGDKDRTNDPSPDVLAKRHVQVVAGRNCVGTQEPGGLNPCP